MLFAHYNCHTSIEILNKKIHQKYSSVLQIAKSKEKLNFVILIEKKEEEMSR